MLGRAVVDKLRHTAVIQAQLVSLLPGLLHENDWVHGTAFSDITNVRGIVADCGEVFYSP